MPTLDEMQKRYSRTESEVDSIGRTITIGLLRPDQRYRILELTDSTSPYVLMPFMQAATVRKITSPQGDEIAYQTPKTRDDLDRMLRLLDDEGQRAVAKAYDRLSPPSEDGKPAGGNEAAGN